MAPQSITITVEVGREGSYHIDVPLDPGTLNERLFDVGRWLVEWEIPHQARIDMQPQRGRVRINFPEERHARAFQMQFGGEVVEE